MNSEDHKVFYWSPTLSLPRVCFVPSTSSHRIAYYTWQLPRFYHEITSQVAKKSSAAASEGGECYVVDVA